MYFTVLEQKICIKFLPRGLGDHYFNCVTRLVLFRASLTVAVSDFFSPFIINILTFAAHHTKVPVSTVHSFKDWVIVPTTDRVPVPITAHLCQSGLGLVQ